MTTYTAIPDTDIDSESPLTAALMTALRNNPIAINEYDIGVVEFFARNTAPTGYLKANGAAVSRTTYAALFAVIGTTFGAGDGSTTFNVPDMRAEFPRGWDDGRGVDSGRSFGSAQADDFKSHAHGIVGYSGNPGSSPTISSSVLNQVTVNTQSNGGTETRPRNIALLACIKYTG